MGKNRKFNFVFSGGVALSSAQVFDGVGPIWLDDVNCKGDERNLDSCNHLTYGDNDCKHDEDVGVRCGKPIICILNLCCVIHKIQQFKR